MMWVQIPNAWSFHVEVSVSLVIIENKVLNRLVDSLISFVASGIGGLSEKLSSRRLDS